MATMSGTIARLVRDKGFGFIKTTHGGDEFFFHMSAVRDGNFAGLSEGQSVTFDEETGPKGPRAGNVKAA